MKILEQSECEARDNFAYSRSSNAFNLASFPSNLKLCSRIEVTLINASSQVTGGWNMGLQLSEIHCQKLLKNLYKIIF